MKTFPRAVLILALIHFLLFIYIALVNPNAFLLDDAYYSLTIAANIADGKGITYGGFPTNGFQPLYSFLMTPLFALLGVHRMLCLRIAFLFLGLCSAGSLLVLYRIAHRYAGNAAALIAVILGALSVNLVSHAASGLETALHGLLFLIVVDYYTIRRTRLASRSSIVLGLLLGVTAYGRLDACFLFLAIGIDRFMLNRKTIPIAIRENFVIFVPALLLLAPWFIWNLAAFGTIAQSSGAFHHWRGMVSQGVDYALPGFLLFAAVKLISLTIKLPLEPLTGIGALTSVPAKLLLGSERIRSNFALELWQKSPLAAMVLAALALAILALLLFFGREGFRRMKTLRSLAWLVWALAGAALYYPLYLINYSMRHFYGYALILAVPVAVFIASLLKLDRDGPVLSSKKNAIVIALLIVAIFRCGPMNPLLPRGNDYGFSRIAAIREAIPPGASIGYTDCGFYSYFLPEYTIVNLDGILNFEAQEAMKKNRMSRYLVESRVEYVLALHNLRHDFKHQFESDMLSVLEPVDDSDLLFRVTPVLK